MERRQGGKKLKSIFLWVILPPFITILLAALVALVILPTWFPEIDRLEQVELGLLIALISAEILMFYVMHRERTQRQDLVKSMLETRRVFGREDYLSLIDAGIKQAETEVLFITRSMTTPEREPLMKRIIRASMAKKKRRGFIHRGIVAPRHDTIEGAYELIERAAIDIRFHDYCNLAGLRYVIIDKRKTILGVGKPDEPSEESYSIESYTVAKALEAEFEKLWNDDEAMTFPEYVRKTSEKLGELPTSEKASRLGIPEEVIQDPEKVVNRARQTRGL